MTARKQPEKKKASARRCAVEILRRQASSAHPVDQVMEEVLRAAACTDSRDRHLVMALVYGVLRWRGFLDTLLDRYTSHPRQKMQPLLLDLLRIGLVQIFFLDRIPAGVAINETVETGKALRLPAWVTGFANALLRRVARERGQLPDPWAESSLLASHPGWLVERWRQRYGLSRTVAICRANNTPPPLVLRVNTKAISIADCRHALAVVEGLDPRFGIFSPAALRIVNPRDEITRLPGYGVGHFMVQSEAAQLVAFLLDRNEPAAYLDGCAGVGGKTSQLAELLPADARLVAAEPNPQRCRLLEENLARLRLADRVQVIAAPLGSPAVAETGPYDQILLDAPCSGLGVIRRQPDIRWNRSAADLVAYQRQQLELLGQAAGLLKPGGGVVYATCSTEPEENEEVVQKFLDDHPDFERLDVRGLLPEKARSLADRQGFFRSLPDEEDLDGFFAARLRRLP